MIRKQNNNTFQEQPSGTINGVNTTFTLSFSPNYQQSVMVFVNGLYKAPFVDYTISGTTITFTEAPAAGQLPRVVYILQEEQP